MHLTVYKAGNCTTPLSSKHPTVSTTICCLNKDFCIDDVRCFIDLRHQAIIKLSHVVVTWVLQGDTSFPQLFLEVPHSLLFRTACYARSCICYINPERSSGAGKLRPSPTIPLSFIPPSHHGKSRSLHSCRFTCVIDRSKQCLLWHPIRCHDSSRTMAPCTILLFFALPIESLHFYEHCD